MSTRTDGRGAPDTVRTIVVIETTVLRGTGVTSDPCRMVTQYWSSDEALGDSATLLAEYDPCAKVPFKRAGER